MRFVLYLFIYSCHYFKIVRLRTFDRLSFMVENQDVKEPSLTIYIMSLYRHYWHYHNVSPDITNNSHQRSDYNSDRFIKTNNSVENESVAPSIATRSINLAVTVVGELLK
jgi:hypothetical protein